MNSQVQQLKNLAAYLSPHGQVRMFSIGAGQLGQKLTKLIYSTEGLIPFHWPVTGRIDCAISWNETTDTWLVEGTIFGETPHGTDPKTWFHNAARAIKTREQILKGFFQQAMSFWERYRGDLEQFQYRLGIQMAATGTMHRYPQGFYWQHNAHQELRVYFSVDSTEPEYGMPPAALFGFYDSPKMHLWPLTVKSLADLREKLAEFSHSARVFCQGASSCFGAADFSDIPE